MTVASYLQLDPHNQRGNSTTFDGGSSFPLSACFIRSRWRSTMASMLRSGTGSHTRSTLMPGSRTITVSGCPYRENTAVFLPRSLNSCAMIVSTSSPFLRISKLSIMSSLRLSVHKERRLDRRAVDPSGVVDDVKILVLYWQPRVAQYLGHHIRQRCALAQPWQELLEVKNGNCVVRLDPVPVVPGKQDMVNVLVDRKSVV